MYGGTYACVNTVETRTAHATKRTKEVSKFVFVSSTNLTLNITKDRIFSQMFGNGPIRAVPLRSLAAFGLRDSMTVLTSFSIAPVIGDALAPEFGLLGRTAAQVVSPLLVQFISAPIHLIGLDYYNRPELLHSSQRLAMIQSEYWKTSLSRCARIFPAFSILPLINAPVRSTLRNRLL